jgi:type IV secretory pathway TraG/TraD family ATPase VirD4
VQKQRTAYFRQFFVYKDGKFNWWYNKTIVNNHIKNMDNNILIKKSFTNALAMLVYVTLVATFMGNVERIFAGHQDSVVAPMSMLLLFVTSATISAGLIIGKPIMLYLDNQKQDAVKLFGYTVAWMFVFTLIALALNLLF